MNARSPLNAGEIERDLGTARVGRHVICFPSVASTNDVARDSLRQDGADGLVVFAEVQTRGRGRHGRAWHSRPGMGLASSVLLVESGAPLPAESVTIAGGLATAEAIAETCRVSCELKWPNDVLVDGRKVAGVLVERVEVAGRTGTIIGVGINVFEAPPRGSVDRAAACLADQTPEPPCRLAIARALLRRLDARIEDVRAGRLDALHDAWIALCGMLQQRISAICSGQVYTGRVVDVHPLDGLELVDDHGVRLLLPADRTTLRV